LRSFLWLGLVLLAGCGAHSPSAPSTTAPGGGLPFQSALYELRIVGDPLRCTGDVLRVGTLVSLAVNLTPDASGWTGRPADPANGTLVLTLRPGSLPSSPPRFQLGGAVQGFAIDAGTGPLPVRTGRRLTFGSTADAVTPISGVTPGSVLAAVGPIEGPAAFTLEGLTTTCPAGAVLWSLVPPGAL
jgi:hypothetical protein